MERVGQLLQTAIAVKAHVSWVVGNASHVSRYRLAKAVAKHDLALVVGAPERVRRGWPRERGASGGVASAAPPSDQTMTVQHGVHGADRWELRRGRLPPQLQRRCRPVPGAARRAIRVLSGISRSFQDSVAEVFRPARPADQQDSTPRYEARLLRDEARVHDHSRPLTTTGDELARTR
jgi:hypothetical protein